MTSTARDQLGALLASLGSSLPPCVQWNASPQDLTLEVDGLGRIPLPVPAALARQLIALAAPARFGRGTQTVTDPQVRDTWEVPRELVRTTWTPALTQALETARGQFALPEGARLVPELHSLLVYETGQFFHAHQDSEKSDAMIATLVVTLPSRHTGGELVIHHAGESRTHRGWPRELALVAFHADRRHEVRPVTSGYRVTLTYNLLIEGDDRLPEPSGTSSGDALADCLTRHFTTPVVRSYTPAPAPPPRRLVYLLDHEYTERSLDWSRLKGVDRSRVALLRSAAELAGCQIALAATDVQETWEAYEPERRYRRRYRDEPPEGDGPDDLDVQYLIDSAITLTHWVEGSGSARPRTLTISSDEVCASTPSTALEPYSWNYEGYMGNWGNTLDRWYRRAAVVVWPRELGFAIRAESEPVWALEELTRLAAAGTLDQARAAVGTLEPIWDRIALPEDDGTVVGLALRAAAALEGPESALVLLRRFRIEDLRTAHAPQLCELAVRYGPAWTTDLLTTWFTGRRAWSGRTLDRATWLTRLPELAAALCAGPPAAVTMATALVSLAWEGLRAELNQALAETTPSRKARRLDAAGASLAALLSAVSIVQSKALRRTVVGFARTRREDLIACSIATLRAAAGLTPEQRLAGGFDDLAAGSAEVLRARGARPERAEDDWSLAAPEGCDCQLCTHLAQFVRDPVQRSLEWPLAAPKRAHVHSRIEATELPIDHVTRRSGSPFTLVLTKQGRLFASERRARDRDRQDLAWLKEAWLPAATSPRSPART